MAIFYLVTGIASGATMAMIGFLAGHPIWAILLFYSLGGALAVLGAAGLVGMLPHRLAADNDGHVDFSATHRLDVVAPEGSRFGG